MLDSFKGDSFTVLDSFKVDSVLWNLLELQQLLSATAAEAEARPNFAFLQKRAYFSSNNCFRNKFLFRFERMRLCEESATPDI